MPHTSYPTTPDGRYFVVRGRLWRTSNPDLPAHQKEVLVQLLMDARRSLRVAATEVEVADLRAAVDAAKRALGERGPVWWTDGSPDLNRKLVKTTPYASWFATLTAG